MCERCKTRVQFCSAAPHLCSNAVIPVKGVHAVCGRRQADRRHRWEARPGVGSEEYGLRSAKEGIQSQVSDEVHPSLPQQTGAICNERCGLQVELDLGIDFQQGVGFHFEMTVGFFYFFIFFAKVWR